MASRASAHERGSFASHVIELHGNEYTFPGEEEVPVDVLIYDLGPNKLVRKLRFVAGELESVETLGHGISR